MVNKKLAKRVSQHKGDTSKKKVQITGSSAGEVFNEEDDDAEIEQLEANLEVMQDASGGDTAGIPKDVRKYGAHIDITRLVYHPRPPAEKRSEKTTGRNIDFIFFGCSALILIVSMHYLLTGLTVLAFTSSIKSLHDDENLVKNNYYLHAVQNTSPSAISIGLIAATMIQVANVIFGVYACVQQYRNALIAHTTISVIYTFIELVLAAIMINDSECAGKDLDLATDRMLLFIRSFGGRLDESTVTASATTDTSEKDNFEFYAYQLDSIQVGLSCCGSDSWVDYMNPLIRLYGNVTSSNITIYPTATDFDEIETVFPSSCCRQWWVRNTHCAKGVHRWAHPKVDNATALLFRQRINQGGCTWKIKNTCLRIHSMIKNGFLVCFLVDLFLTLVKTSCSVYIIKTVLKIVRKKKHNILTQTLGVDADDIGDDGTESTTAIESIPLPTDNEIEIIKARTDFNRFAARVKRTQIGMWMREAKKSVFLTFSDVPKKGEELAQDYFKKRGTFVDRVMAAQTQTNESSFMDISGTRPPEKFDAGALLKLEKEERLKQTRREKEIKQRIKTELAKTVMKK